jgi:hypothetical protein
VAGRSSREIGTSPPFDLCSIGGAIEYGMGIIWSVRTRGGLEAHLRTIYVTGTCDGVLFGSPNAQMNQRLVVHAVKAAQSADSGSPVYLVPPRLVTRESATLSGMETAEQRPDELPAFRCIGHFISFQPRDEENHASALTILWFQHQSPVEGIDLQLGELDWFDHARDFCY